MKAKLNTKCPIKGCNNNLYAHCISDGDNLRLNRWIKRCECGFISKDKPSLFRDLDVISISGMTEPPCINSGLIKILCKVSDCESNCNGSCGLLSPALNVQGECIMSGLETFFNTGKEEYRMTRDWTAFGGGLYFEDIERIVKNENPVIRIGKYLISIFKKPRISKIDMWDYRRCYNEMLHIRRYDIDKTKKFDEMNSLKK